MVEFFLLKYFSSESLKINRKYFKNNINDYCGIEIEKTFKYLL